MRQKFDDEICPKVAERFGISNRLALPRLEKVIINVGIGKELDGTKLRQQAKDQVLSDLTAIAAQKPVMIKARKSVANFKVREGYEIGAMVTIRGTRMWEFVDRLLSLAIPRVKDFRGLSDKAFDKAGNYSIGIQEQGIFPEINMAEAQFSHGMNVNFVFSNSDPDQSRFVLEELGVPFVREADN